MFLQHFAIITGGFIETEWHMQYLKVSLISLLNEIGSSTLALNVAISIIM